MRRQSVGRLVTQGDFLSPPFRSCALFSAMILNNLAHLHTLAFFLFCFGHWHCGEKALQMCLKDGLKHSENLGAQL